LRAVVKASTDGVPGAPPRRALHEVLRGEVLATLRESMSREEGLEVVLAIVRSMALDPRVANVAMARADLAFVKEFLAEARAVSPSIRKCAPKHFSRWRKCRWPTRMCLRSMQHRVRCFVRTQRHASRKSYELRSAQSGRAFAIALELRGRLARAAGDPAKATADFEAARAALGDTPDTFDSARIARWTCGALGRCGSCV
jgi:hypothetical protein